MDSRQTRFLLATVAVVVLLWAITPFLAGHRPQTVPLSAEASTFDGDRALQQARTFVTRYPRREVGSLQSRQSSGYIQDQFKSLGYELGYMHFDALVRGRREAGRNLFAFRKGRKSQVVAVLAHYDTGRFGVQGATASGASVGSILELARVLGSGSQGRGLLFVVTDAKQDGLFGAQDFVATHPLREQIVAAIALDRIAPGDQNFIHFSTDGFTGAQTPPWLRVLASEAAMSEGVRCGVASGPEEVLERALRLPVADQGPLLDKGIPAIGLSAIPPSAKGDSALPAPQDDDIELLRTESLSRLGRVAERIVRSLASLDSIPQESPGAFMATRQRVLSSAVVGFLRWITFAPLGVSLIFLAANNGRYVSIARLGRELAGMAAVLLPLLTFYYLVQLLRLMRQLPRFPWLPSADEPSVVNPPALPLYSVLGVTLLVAVGSFFGLRFLARQLPKRDYLVSKLVLSALTLICVLIGSVHDGYWALVFLALPAWVWTLVSQGATLGARTANRLMVLTGGLVVPLSIVAPAAAGETPARAAWYLIVVLGNSVIPFGTYLIVAFAAALMIQFASVQSTSGELS